MLPVVESTARPCGPLKSAAEPVPSVLPVVPAVPARVVTTPPGVIMRMVSLPVSATKTSPVVGSSVTPTGPLNRAAEPVPSVLPAVPAVPARVVTTPAGVIMRIVSLPVSAT